jgi:hypothetical protein
MDDTTQAALDRQTAAKPAKKKKASKPKAKSKSKPKAKKVAAERKPAPKKAAKPKKAATVVTRPERLDLRLTKGEKAKLSAKAEAMRRTITSVVQELIEKMK